MKIELRFCNEKFWNKLINAVKALAMADKMSSMPNAHVAPEVVGSLEDIDTVCSAKLLNDVDDIS